MGNDIYLSTNTSDIPFEVFSLFSRGNQSVHAGTLLLIASLTDKDLEGAIRYDDLVDSLKNSGLVQSLEPEEKGVKPEVAELSLLKKYQLIRRQSRYDQSEMRWVDYVYMTGRGRKVADFLVSISQTDIQQTKEANIQSSLLSMRAVYNDDPINDIILYDALKAAHEGILDLITHMSSFSESFRDFITANTQSVENAMQAKEWISTMLHSNLLTEYFTIDEAAYSYSAKLAEIKTIALKLKEEPERIEAIVDQEYKRRVKVSQNTKADVFKEEIEEDVMMRINRLYEMTDYEYHNYLRVISELVSEIIQRTYFILTSFGAGNDNSSIIMKLARLVRYCTITGNPVPLSISNFYDHAAVDPDSLRACRVKAEEGGESFEDLPDIGVFEEQERTFRTRKQEAIDMAKELIHHGETVNITQLPCSTLDDFTRLFLLTGAADKENNPVSEFDFKTDGEKIRRGDFIIPNGEYTRD